MGKCKLRMNTVQAATHILLSRKEVVLLMKQWEFACDHVPVMMYSQIPDLELTISKAFLASLKKRGLLTSEQVAECTIRLEKTYCR